MDISNTPDFPEDWARDSEMQIAIDFDGVIHDPFDGARNGECYGGIIPGAKEAIIKLAEKYEVVLFTCKGRPNGPVYENGNTGVDLVWNWLYEHGLAEYVKDVTATKPNARCYIDDKAVRHTDWGNTMADMAKLGII